MGRSNAQPHAATSTDELFIPSEPLNRSNTQSHPANSPDDLFIPSEAARKLRTNVRTMERWRTLGNGPPFVRVGRRVAYRRGDLDAWVQANVVRHTSEPSSNRAGRNAGAGQR